MMNSSTFSSTNTLVTSKSHFLLNIISLTATSLGTVISFVILTTVLIRRKTFHNVSLLLCTNSYLLVFVLGIFEILHNINTLQGDLGFIKMDRSNTACRFQAYVVFSIGSAVYLACILQAVFRLCRIVYPTVLWLVNIHMYLIIIPLTWILSFTLVSPLYILHSHKLIPGEYICRITKTDAFSIAYGTITVYGLPFIILAITYFKLHRFLRQQLLAAKFRFRSRRGQRDILVFRRIITMVILLGSYGMPNSIMLIMLAITGELVSYFYRVLELSFASGVLTLSLGILYVTPQLRRKLQCSSRKTRIQSVTTRKHNIKQRIINHQ